LFDPLGIEGMDWETDSQGSINAGGYGLRVRTEDIAKFGQLYLQKGMWNGKQLIPADWVANATTSHVDNSPAEPKRPNAENDWAQGYGYQFWRCTHGAFRGDGAFGQFCIVLPDKDTVVAITAESFDLQGSLNLVWNHLYPALRDGVLPQDRPASSRRATQEFVLEAASYWRCARDCCSCNRKVFVLAENEFKAKSVSFKLSNNACEFTLSDEAGKQSVRCGMGKWVIEEIYTTQRLFPLPNRPKVFTPLAASAAWSDPNTLTMTWRYAATAHSDQIICKFEEGKVTISFLGSVSKGNPNTPDKRTELHGTIV